LETGQIKVFGLFFFYFIYLDSRSRLKRIKTTIMEEAQEKDMVFIVLFRI
jgi:hypothetical protein